MAAEMIQTVSGVEGNDSESCDIVCRTYMEPEVTKLMAKISRKMRLIRMNIYDRGTLKNHCVDIIESYGM